MIELAVFGSLMLLGLAFLVRYGLLYNYQQMTQQEAFRQALIMGHSDLAWPYKQGSVALVRDRRMVDPSNPFVTGSRQTFVGAASVSMGTAGGVLGLDKDWEIPVQRTILNDGDNPIKLRLADFRDETILKARVCAYVDVYGRSSVAIPDPFNPLGDPLYYVCKTRFDGPKIKHDPFPANPFVTIRILDGCIGDVLNTAGCRQQCKAIQDAAIFEPAYCSSLPGDDARTGIELDHLTHERTVNRNERIRNENWGAHQSESHVDESDRYHRKINLSPIRSNHPNDFDHTDYDTNDDGVIDTDQTIRTQRDETFSTPW